jgi:hypothetical protein
LSFSQLFSNTKKTVPVNKGGYCEACDYWYKCSLREHIKSAKHEKFVKDQTNFQHLDDVINKLPSLSDFLLKLDDLTGQVKTSVQIQHDTISDKIIPLDQYTGDKSCIEKNIYKMPSLDKELTVDRNIEHEEQIQNMTRDVEIPSLFRTEIIYKHSIIICTININLCCSAYRNNIIGCYSRITV